MRPVVQSVSFDPDTTTLPADPAEFRTLAMILVGDGHHVAGEAVYVEVCTPEALVRRCSDEGIVGGHGLLIVDWSRFDERTVEKWLRQAVERVEASTWAEVGLRLAAIGAWEFDE